MTNCSPPRLRFAVGTMAEAALNHDAAANRTRSSWCPSKQSFQDTCRWPRLAPSPASPRARCDAPSLPGSYGHITSAATFALSCVSCSAGSKRTVRPKPPHPASPIPALARVRAADRWRSTCTPVFIAKGRPDADAVVRSPDRRSAARVRRAGRSPGIGCRSQWHCRSISDTRRTRP